MTIWIVYVILIVNSISITFYSIKSPYLLIVINTLFGLMVIGMIVNFVMGSLLRMMTTLIISLLIGGVNIVVFYFFLVC